MKILQACHGPQEAVQHGCQGEGQWNTLGRLGFQDRLECREGRGKHDQTQGYGTISNQLGSLCGPNGGFSGCHVNSGTPPKRSQNDSGYGLRMLSNTSWQSWCLGWAEFDESKKVKETKYQSDSVRGPNFALLNENAVSCPKKADDTRLKNGNG
jgi:hypothetical protein